MRVSCLDMMDSVSFIIEQTSERYTNTIRYTRQKKDKKVYDQNAKQSLENEGDYRTNCRIKND